MLARDSDAFTVISQPQPAPPALGAPPRVHVVRPLQRDAELTAPAQTILDPKFTRALDFKLRRLKDKEILESNLRRPTRQRRRRAALAASDPDLPRLPLPRGNVSGSQPLLGAMADGKPRFVTTVPSGQFLLPPPGLARLLGLPALSPPPRQRLVYEYASRPQPIAPRSRRTVSTVPNGVPPDKPSHAGEAFRGVRALIAGVAGVRHLLEERDHVLVHPSQ